MPVNRAVYRGTDGPLRSLDGPNRSINGPNRSIDGLPLETVNLIDLGVAEEPKDVRSRVLAGTNSVLCLLNRSRMEMGSQRNLVDTRFGGALFQLMRHQMRTLMSFHLLDDADP